jgi:hypothetical protein
MRQSPQEVIRIGSSAGRIIQIAQNRMVYIDMAGQEQFIDLEACAKHWARHHDDHRQQFLPLFDTDEQRVAKWNARCVGQRGALDHPPWAEFMNERKTRFLFDTSEALYGQLLGPLKQVGWRTFDTN